MFGCRTNFLNNKRLLMNDEIIKMKIFDFDEDLNLEYVVEKWRHNVNRYAKQRGMIMKIISFQVVVARVSGNFDSQGIISVPGMSYLDRNEKDRRSGNFVMRFNNQLFIHYSLTKKQKSCLHEF